MFEKIKNLFKKNSPKEYQNSEVFLNKQENKENNFESSQIEIESEPVIKQIKRSLKYRK